LHNRFVNKIIPKDLYEKDGLVGGLRLDNDLDGLAYGKNLTLIDSKAKDRL